MQYSGVSKYNHYGSPYSYNSYQDPSQKHKYDIKALTPAKWRRGDQKVPSNPDNHYESYSITPTAEQFHKYLRSSTMARYGLNDRLPPGYHNNSGIPGLNNGTVPLNNHTIPFNDSSIRQDMVTEHFGFINPDF